MDEGAEIGGAVRGGVLRVSDRGEPGEEEVPGASGVEREVSGIGRGELDGLGGERGQEDGSSGGDGGGEGWQGRRQAGGPAIAAKTSKVFDPAAFLFAGPGEVEALFGASESNEELALEFVAILEFARGDDPTGQEVGKRDAGEGIVPADADAVGAAEEERGAIGRRVEVTAGEEDDGELEAFGGVDGEDLNRFATGGNRGGFFLGGGAHALEFGNEGGEVGGLLPPERANEREEFIDIGGDGRAGLGEVAGGVEQFGEEAVGRGGIEAGALAGMEGIESGRTEAGQDVAVGQGSEGAAEDGGARDGVERIGEVVEPVEAVGDLLGIEEHTAAAE